MNADDSAVLPLRSRIESIVQSSLCIFESGIILDRDVKEVTGEIMDAIAEQSEDAPMERRLTDRPDMGASASTAPTALRIGASFATAICSRP